MSRAPTDSRIITVDADDSRALPEEESRRVCKRSACVDCGTPIEIGEVERRTAYEWSELPAELSTAGQSGGYLARQGCGLFSGDSAPAAQDDECHRAPEVVVSEPLHLRRRVRPEPGRGTFQP